MIFSFGKKKTDDVEVKRFEPVRLQGAVNGQEADLAGNAKLVQAGLVPAKEILTDALSRRAELIRLEPKGERSTVTLLIDGLAYPGTKLPAPAGNAITQVLKLLAGLDIKQRKAPQKGGIKAEFDERPYELWVETSPVMGGGERLTVSARDLKQKLDSPEEIGITDQLKAKIRGLVAEHRGVLLVCGPAHSGTTTTTFAVMRSIDRYTHSMYSIADLGTQSLIGVSEFEVKPGEALKTTIERAARMEAEILFLNPIKDAQTAAAALTSADNIVLVSEFEAKDAASGIVQLIEWMFVGGGVAEPTKPVAEGLQGIISQKLIRTLCTECREAYRPNPKMIAKVGLPEETEVLYRAPKKETLQAQASAGGYVPCSNCNATGYRGRNAMFELIEMTAAMRKLVASGPTVEQIQALARKEGMPSLQQDGLRLVAAGKTSLEELQRVFKTG